MKTMKKKWNSPGISAHVVTTLSYHAHKIVSYNWIENKYCLLQDNLPIAVTTQNFLP